MAETVAALIPTIPPRRRLLRRAVYSVNQQHRPVDQLVIQTDTQSIGAAANRNAGLEKVTADWVALLDDDDEWLPHHVGSLLRAAKVSGADLVYPLWRGANVEIFKKHLHRPFDDEHRKVLMTRGSFIPITVLVRTEALRAVGGFECPPGTLNRGGTAEDWWTWRKLLIAGYQFYHHQEVTWTYNAHPRHTSGYPWKTGKPKSRAQPWWE